MRYHAACAPFLLLALLLGCAKSVVVAVPPRVDLSRYELVGIVDFTSNSDRSIDARATRQFQEQVQAAQPGTRFIELGARDALLGSVGARQLDAQSVRKIGERHGVAALFIGELVYTEPTTSVKVTDLARMEGGVRAEIRGDISARLLEARTGASVWSDSAWAIRQIGRLNVSVERGVSGTVGNARPQEEMVPALVHHLTQDFRPSSARQPAK